MTRDRPSWPMTLSLPSLLAARYVRSTRREAYVTFLSILATAGIALGVAALILVLAGLDGLQTFLRSDVLARTPHLEIELPAGADAGALVAELRGVAGVEGARRLLRGRGWMLVGQRALDVAVVGFEGRLPEFFPGASGRAPGLYVDEGTAARWGLELGDRVEIVSPRPTLSPFGPQPIVRQLPLAGTFATGQTEDQEHRLAVPLATAVALFGGAGVRLELRAAGLDEALALAARLGPMLPAGSRVRTWKDLNRGLFLALELEKLLMFVSVFLIVPVAAVALVTVLALLISSKREEIGILMAMGATPADLRRAFLRLGGLLAGTGLALGVVLGAGGAWLADRFHLVRPPGDVYFIDHIPFRLEAGDLAAVIGATLVLTVGSTFWAAHKAAAMRVVEAFRT